MITINYNNNEVVSKAICTALYLEEVGEIITLKFKDDSSGETKEITLEDVSIYPERFSRFELTDAFLNDLDTGSGVVTFYRGTTLIATERYINNKSKTTLIAPSIEENYIEYGN